MPNKLPIGWVKTQLGEVCAKVATIRPEDSPDTEFTYFDIGGIDNQSNRIVETKTFVGREAPSRARQSVRKDDILFSTVRTYLKKIARIEQDYSHPVASTGFTVIRAAEGVSPQFLFSQVLSEDFLQPIHALQTGSSYPAVRDKDVFAQPIRLAPSPEQERIVAKLDSLLSRVAAGETATRRALDRLQRYRATVLHAAVTGELTRDWRKSHKPSESGAQLLKRLLEERRARWEEAELERLQGAGKPPRDDKWKKRYPDPKPPKTGGLPSLPKEWVWTNLSQLKVYSIYGPRFGKSDYSRKGVAVLRTTDIDERGHVSLENCPKLPLSENEFQKYKVQVGDLLITRTGSIGTLAIFNDTVRAIPGAYLLHYRLISPALAKMAYTFLISPNGHNQLWEQSAGSGRQNLSVPGLENISLPMPPLAEQKEIISQIERRQTAADRLAATLNDQLDRAQATRRSLLRDAFAGKLVPQDPHDEPASILLERIRTTRQAETKKTKAKRMPKSRVHIQPRSLLEVLLEHKRPLSPEELFRAAGYSEESVDSFYAELRELTTPPAKIEEIRSKGKHPLLKACL
jgi:type I restriction enzyme, S subunit